MTKVKNNDNHKQDQLSIQTGSCLRAGGVSVGLSTNVVNVPRIGGVAGVCLLRDEIKSRPIAAGISDTQTPDERGETGIWHRSPF